MKTTILNDADLILPDWPAPTHVRAIQTTRRGGVSRPPYDAFNLGDHVGDAPLDVNRNRQLLHAWLPSEPVWLRQVHGTDVVEADHANCLPQGDAAVARKAGTVCVVMTADCLPLLVCDHAGRVVAAIHAGWRGLLAGVIEAAVGRMQVAPASLMVWLGPAIGSQAFEVGDEVRAAFVAHDPLAVDAFTEAGQAGKWKADIYRLARQRLAHLGVSDIYGGDLCTHGDAQRFYSYRRDGVTGRMASMIWLDRG